MTLLLIRADYYKLTEEGLETISCQNGEEHLSRIRVLLG
jgi:hypothetical protein